MDKFTYYFIRYVIFSIIYSTGIVIVDIMFTDFLLKFGMMFLVGILFYTAVTMLKIRVKIPVRKHPVNIMSKLLNILLKSLIIATSAVAMITFTITGDEGFFFIQDNFLLVNLTYVFVYSMIFLIIAIITIIFDRKLRF